ncbi:Txe/YoeB family addiction module toxin [Pinibacter aurantiacus]|uniref:Txe/YoeB family addiction module toxin n=1 Tax=Pinibacter aurantiacus TaxID=2851599 RepID=A0A9E2W580_9BACT|nr:Txe/YoeB family addiction module toxin [Pinibacter aurantiacus]MBV4358624.1 Txe/YoeB family addiction module toxin [Pinibacter aurantiacus]
MKYTFTEEGWEDYQYWFATDKKTFIKINDLIKEIKRDPFKGIGKPEPLKYEYRGFWSRRITEEHRLIYTVDNNDIIIVKCRHHY